MEITNWQSAIGNVFWAGDVTDSIEVLQTSCEGLTPSQSTKEFQISDFRLQIGISWTKEQEVSLQSAT